MITPLDIQNKEFSRAVRGYKEEDVDGFLDLLTLDLEKILEENRRLKEQIKNLTAELERFKNSEETVLKTLEAAKALMSDISVSAEKRAEILLKNAELDAQLIQREAKENIERLNEEMLKLKNSLIIFKSRYRSLLESELEKFDNLSEELFGNKELGDLKPYTEDKIKSEDVASFGKSTITNLRKGEGV
ncbi:MAG: DivIVA domain-containing protein [Anaerovoracaceae bacterium]|jgi:cell division initiation protein